MLVNLYLQEEVVESFKYNFLSNQFSNVVSDYLLYKISICVNTENSFVKVRNLKALKLLWFTFAIK